MSYKINHRDGEYALIENEQTVIMTFKSRRRANEVCRGLNLGKGFNGNTPKFFTYCIAPYLMDEDETP